MNSTKVVGIWDDHDFGGDNSDGTFEHKEVLKEVFLDFIDEP